MISLVASHEYPELGPDDRAHLLGALDRAGVAWRIDPWDAPGVDWAGFDAVVVRAPWDYFRRLGEFRRWTDAREADRTRLWNPARVLTWNMHKGYLRDLLAKGVRVVDTEWLRAGDDVKEVLARRGWTRAVAKPAVSAGGWRTAVVTAATDQMVSDGELMLQPFLPQIVDEGEWSVVFFGGTFSHAFVKRPAPGNFLVQERHGGSVHAMDLPNGLLAGAERVLEHVPGDLLYARVDGIRDADGSLTLLELEIFEPVLYFAAAPGSADAFVTALLARM